MALQSPMGHRQDYLLVAQVEDDRWFCHKGSLHRSGVLDDDEPFAVKDLVLKDIRRDAFGPDDMAPRRRIGPHTIGLQLLQAARARAHSWAGAVAVATWRAEEIRSARRPFDLTVASAAYAWGRHMAEHVACMPRFISS